MRPAATALAAWLAALSPALAEPLVCTGNEPFWRLDIDGSQQTPDWITLDTESLRVTMVGLPGPADFSLPVDVNIVVEFLAR